MSVILPLVTGEILLPQGQVIPTEAVAYVRLLDVTLADAPSIVVTEQAIRDVAERAAHGGGVPFELHGRADDPRASYTVQVHISLNGDGNVRHGDLVSTRSYPVLTYGYPSHVRVQTVPVP